MNNETLLKNLRNVPDFPIPGIQFKDVSTLYKNPRCLKIMVNELYELYKDKGITKVVGIESCGFVVMDEQPKWFWPPWESSHTST